VLQFQYEDRAVALTPLFRFNPASLQRVAMLWAAVLMLAACTPLTLSEEYNPQIEDGLNAYHTSFISFVARMEQSAGTAAGAYDGEDARQFYSDSAGALANLVVRAKAQNPQGQCAASSPIASGVTATLAQAASFFEANPTEKSSAAQLGETVKESLAELSEGTSGLANGSCTVVVLTALKLNHEIFQSIHQRLGHLRPPASTIGADLISQSVQMAIITEQSKKP
jgi:hypothetical protein